MPRIEDHLANKVVELRNAHITRYEQRRNRSQSQGSVAPTQTIVGGYVRSYTFDYIPEETIAQGRMYVEFESSYYECPATMVLLGSEPRDGITAERIVEKTHKICDCSDAFLEAYFCAFCEEINRWLVAYEPFDGYFNSEAANSLPSFFREDDISNLTDHWRNQIKSFVNALSWSREQGVVHGSLDNATSYVLSAGRVKIINVAKRQYGQKIPVNDLYDLNNLIWNDQFFDARSSANWESLHFLMGSIKMTFDDWKDVVLQHPILLQQDERVACYLQIQVCMWNELGPQERIRFANALYVKMPQYRWHNLTDFINMSNVVYYYLYNNKRGSLSWIYLAIIQFVKNMIDHANDYTHLIGEYWDEERILLEIQTVFPAGFMGMAYSLSKMSPQDLTQLFNSQEAQQLTDFYIK